MKDCRHYHHRAKQFIHSWSVRFRQAVFFNCLVQTENMMAQINSTVSFNTAEKKRIDIQQTRFFLLCRRKHDGQFFNKVPDLFTIAEFIE